MTYLSVHQPRENTHLRQRHGGCSGLLCEAKNSM